MVAAGGNHYVEGNDVLLLGEFYDETKPRNDPDYYVDPITVSFRVQKATSSPITLSGSEVVKDDVGRYHAVLTADVVGVWGCEVIGSGTVNAVDFWQLTVDPAPF